MTKPITPWDLTIEAEPADEIDRNHATIGVHVQYDREKGPFSMADVVAGYRWCAAIQARLACRLASDLATMRRDHGCQSPPGFGCGAELNEYDLAFELESPSLLIWVWDEHDLDEWVAKVRKVLEDIYEGDRWQPSAEEEAEWAAG